MSDQNTLKIRNWVITLIVTVILAALANGGILVNAIATLKANQLHLQLEVRDLKVELKEAVTLGTQKRYTSEDATADKKVLTDLIASVNRRVDLLEQIVISQRGQTASASGLRQSP